ncbi:5432_t:CDS:2 [Paraglomus occultum]|uniref:Acyl-protein thioesterase 1 n=1 Tax=Paraglomus occultum TaxID=144539 RepID=A0A9N9F1R8_9GLOM|nr:5432_t:CDS:2 [Paraglomus occultum]
MDTDVCPNNPPPKKNFEEADQIIHLDYPQLMRAVSYVNEIIEKEIAAGIPPEKIIIAGYSQGALLTLAVALTSQHKLGGQAILLAMELQKALGIYEEVKNETNPEIIQQKSLQRLQEMDDKEQKKVLKKMMEIYQENAPAFLNAADSRPVQCGFESHFGITKAGVKNDTLTAKEINQLIDVDVLIKTHLKMGNIWAVMAGLEFIKVAGVPESERNKTFTEIGGRVFNDEPMDLTSLHEREKNIKGKEREFFPKKMMKIANRILKKIKNDILFSWTEQQE